MILIPDCQNAIPHKKGRHTHEARPVIQGVLGVYSFVPGRISLLFRMYDVLQILLLHIRLREKECGDDIQKNSGSGKQ